MKLQEEIEKFCGSAEVAAGMDRPQPLSYA